MRKLLVLAFALVCSLATVAAPAQAITFGVSENQDRMFSDPLFTSLGIKHTRLVVSYDVMTNQRVDKGEEYRRVQRYFAAANASGTRVLVAFNHSRGNFRDCTSKRKRKKLKVCKLPSVKQYRANVKRFLTEFRPEAVSPWNEINHVSQPTHRSPKRAAQFTNTARKLFRGTLVEGDFLDHAFKPAYAKKFRRALRRKPKICGLHNYVDVNRNRTTGTTGMMRALGCKRYWWTETGGQLRSFGLTPNENRQARSTRRMFKLAKTFRKKTQRIYNYSFYGSPDQGFDAGLVNGATNRPRKAYRVFAGGIKTKKAKGPKKPKK
jgi:hypothetical protein